MNTRTCILLSLLAIGALITSGESVDTDPFASGVHGAVMGALVADALSLGSHYEYSAPTIKKAYGGKPIHSYLAPGERMGGSTHGVGWGRRNYHPGQKKGDGTDYGLYTELVLQFLASTNMQRNEPFDLDAFVPFWRARLELPQGHPRYWGAWRDTQTKQALEKLRRGETDYLRLGGASNAMSVRGASLLGVYDDEESVAAAALLAMFTHGNKEAQLGATFFTLVAFRLVQSRAAGGERLTPMDAMLAVAETMDDEFVDDQVHKGFEKFTEVMDPSRPLGKEEFVDDLAMTSMAKLWDVGKTEPIKVGKASPTVGTMPSSIYIILKHSANADDALNNFVAAARANVMVGGDNASRGSAIGMVLGAYYGIEGIVDPAHGGEAHLKDGLNAWTRCEKWLGQLPLLATGDNSSEGYDSEGYNSKGYMYGEKKEL